MPVPFLSCSDDNVLLFGADGWVVELMPVSTQWWAWRTTSGSWWLVRAGRA
jgi:hypothetical protein